MHRSSSRIALPTALILLVVLAPATGARAITREEILTRGNHWVDLEVPYSQNTYFEGYRTDCSGMASMCWKLDRSYSTRSIAPMGVPILRDELQPGDLLNKYDYHAAIFYKWADSSHAFYWTLEQSGGTGHAVSRLTPYPFWGVEGFVAYRPRHVEEADDYGPYVTEVAGNNRYNTAIFASRLAFPDGTATQAVVCSGQNWPDALGGSSLAGVLGGPVLLVGRDGVPGALDDELARLGVREVTLIGGEAAISPAVARAIDVLPGVSVRRLGGANRYGTAALVASETLAARRQRGLPQDGCVYVVTGQDFPDALGAAAVAAHTGRPILLAERDRLPDDMVDVLRSSGATSAVVAGGYSVLGQVIEGTLQAEGVLEITRLAGRDRYETSLMLAQHGADEGLVWDDVALATGKGFADALAGGVTQARRGSTLVLTPPGSLSPSPDWAIREHRDTIDRVTVFGGETAIRPLARRQIRWILDEP